MKTVENGWSARIKEPEAEVERLNNERIEIQNNCRTVTCVFCGHVYPPGTPSSNHAALFAHVEECPKHPMRKYKLRAEAADAYLLACRKTLTLLANSDEELSIMKGVMIGCGQVELVSVIDAELEYRRFQKG